MDLNGGVVLASSFNLIPLGSTSTVNSHLSQKKVNTHLVLVRLALFCAVLMWMKPPVGISSYPNDIWT
jgi:hypothetical protein